MTIYLWESYCHSCEKAPRRRPLSQESQLGEHWTSNFNAANYLLGLWCWAVEVVSIALYGLFLVTHVSSDRNDCAPRFWSSLVLFSLTFIVNAINDSHSWICIDLRGLYLAGSRMSNPARLCQDIKAGANFLFWSWTILKWLSALAIPERGSHAERTESHRHHCPNSCKSSEETMTVRFWTSLDFSL